MESQHGDEKNVEDTDGVSREKTTSSPYAGLSIKGRGQIRQFLSVIKERKPRITINGYIQDVPLKIIIQRKGKYDLITTEAISLIKMSGAGLKSEVATKNIPALLQNENMRFCTVNCEVKVREQSIRIKPLVIISNRPCIVLGKGSVVMLLETVTLTQKIKGKRITKEQKGKKIL